MTSISTRSLKDLKQITIDALLLSNTKEKPEANMDTIELNDTKVNQATINAITIEKASQRSQELTLGHDKDDQRLLQTSGEDNKSSSNILKDIKKFDGGSTVVCKKAWPKIDFRI